MSFSKLLSGTLLAESDASAWRLTGRNERCIEDPRDRQPRGQFEAVTALLAEADEASGKILELSSRGRQNLHNGIPKKSVVHFLHVGKTGGTAVEFALRPYLDAGRFTIQLHRHNVTLAHVPEGEKVVFFLRQPESRFVSGFYSRQRQGRPRFHFPWTAEEEKAFARFPTANDLAKALSSEDRQLRGHAVEAMQAIAHVRRSFYHWFDNDPYFLQRAGDILFIGFQEQLAVDFEILRRLLRLPDEAALPDDDVAAHRNPSTVDRHLDHESQINLAIWYAKDRRFLELCREIRRHRDGMAGQRTMTSSNSSE